MAIGLSGCSSEGEEPRQACPYIMLGGGAKPIDWEPLATSRAAGDQIDATAPATMGIFAYNNRTDQTGVGYGTVFHNTCLYFTDSITDSNRPAWYEEWPYLNADGTPNHWAYADPQPWIASTESNPVNYKFLAYSPYYADGISVSQSNFAGLRTLTWRNIPRFSARDHIISSSILQYTSARGGYNPEQHIGMTHVMSRLRFCFKLGERYSDLRIIRIKSITVNALQGQTYTLRAVYTLWGSTYVPSFEWERDVTSAPFNMLLFNDDAQPYVEISAQTRDHFEPLASMYVIPNEAIGAITISVVYDVYDLKYQLLRQDDTASNTIHLHLSAYGDQSEHMLEAGYYYDVNVEIQPTFLYVLSDNDPRSDGYLIISPNN